VALVAAFAIALIATPDGMGGFTIGTTA